VIATDQVFVSGPSHDWNPALTLAPVSGRRQPAFLIWSATDPSDHVAPSVVIAKLAAGDTNFGPPKRVFASPAVLTGQPDPLVPGEQAWSDTAAIAITGTSLAYGFNESVVDASHWGTRIVRLR
jgi:hypothetical protein